jgi:hypothetical protein
MLSLANIEYRRLVVWRCIAGLFAVLAVFFMTLYFMTCKDKHVMIPSEMFIGASQLVQDQNDRIKVIEDILANPEVGLWPAGVDKPKQKEFWEYF